MTPSKHQSWADVAVFEDEHAGKTFETFLKEKNLDARTYYDKWARILLFLRPPHKTYRVQVRQDDAKAAHKAVCDAAPNVIKEALHCPSCGSLCVSYPQMTRKFILPTFFLHAGILLRIVDHECYCEQCHFIWHLVPHDAASAAKPAAAHV
jgi:hypothetical protein